MLTEHPARWLAVLGGALALVPAAGCPAPEPASPEPGIADVFELSALRQQVANVGENVRSGLALRRPYFSQEQFAIAEQIAGERFAPSALEARVRDQLAENAASEHIAPVVEWLRTPLGRRLIESVNHTYSPEAAEEMKEFVDDRRANPPTQVRLDLVERYDAAANSAEISAKLLLLAALTGNIMVNALEPRADRLAPEQLIESVDNQYQLLQPVFVETASIQTQMMLQEFSDADVSSLVLFSESAHGKWYHHVTAAALLDAIEESAIEMEHVYLADLGTQPAS